MMWISMLESYLGDMMMGDASGGVVSPNSVDRDDEDEQEGLDSFPHVESIGFFSSVIKVRTYRLEGLIFFDTLIVVWDEEEGSPEYEMK